LVPWIHSLISHVGGNFLILFQLGDNIFTAHDALEQHVDVRVGAFPTLVVWVKVLRFEDGSPGHTIASKALLLQNLCVIQQNVDLARIAKVRPVAHPAENIHSRESLSFELGVKDDCHFLIVEVFEEKARANWEASSKSRIGLLHHLVHLLLVAKQQHASVISRDILHFGNDSVDDGGLVGIGRAVQAICFVND
jgi:hypothetical protein